MRGTNEEKHHLHLLKRKMTRALLEDNPDASGADIVAAVKKEHGSGICLATIATLRREVKKAKGLPVRKRFKQRRTRERMKAERAARGAPRPRGAAATKPAAPAPDRVTAALNLAVEALHNAAQANGASPRIAQLGLARVHLLLLEDGHLPDLRDLKKLIGGVK